MLEVCIEDIAGIGVAHGGGAGRVELCAALDIGGVTPSIATVRAAVAGPLPVYVLIRPRGGGFVYSDAENALIAADIAEVVDAGAAGIVIGAGDRSGLDLPALRFWIDTARRSADRRGLPVGLTLHRVFDLLDDQESAVDAAVALGFDRILTSGGQVRAGDAIATFARLADRAGSAIGIMAGGGLAPESIATLRQAGVGEFHASCRTYAEGEFEPRLTELGFVLGKPRVTDLARVRAYVAAIA